MAPSEENQKVRKSNFQFFTSLLVTEKEWARVRKPVISAFILFHGMLNFCYMFNHHPYTQALNYFFHNYYFFLGLDQDFGVFAPVPRNSNPHLVAVVRFKDGTTRIWNSPRMERLGFLEKIPKERYRKFFDDNCVWEKTPMAWPDIARYVARVSLVEKSNPPETVSLIRFSSRIPPPPMPDDLPPPQGQDRQKQEKPKWEANPPHYESKLLITLKIHPQDLEGVK
ncbi:MAG: hypothetical protein IPM93_29340 [Candidatus Obscuribacter sp.]|nr:hypothetical protein [Candidatus Obscuribacter sp.]